MSRSSAGDQSTGYHERPVVLATLESAMIGDPDVRPRAANLPADSAASETSLGEPSRDDRQSAWDRALATREVDIWVEHLDRTELADCFAFLERSGALRAHGKRVSVAEWLNSLGPQPGHALHSLITGNGPIEDRIAYATFSRWQDRLRACLLETDGDSIPREGVLEYFADELSVCVLVGYRRPGSTATIEGFLAFPHPEAFFDPIRALRYAKSDRQLSLLRRALFSRHKIVLHRNTLLYLDREAAPDVFGPSIDTLFVNEWLFSNRYARQRTHENTPFFAPMTHDDANLSLATGSAFLEIGAGNGLITASFARNEARIREFTAIDMSLAAINCTYSNSSRQRLLPGGNIGDRGRFIVARYGPDAVPQNNDLVVCNPPYVPVPHADLRPRSSHPLADATIGTDLLQSVVGDARRLVGDVGELIIVCSEMAEIEVKSAIPAGYAVAKVASRIVPFDVGPVRTDPDHLRWLRDERGLREDKSRRSYEHGIAIYLITSTAATAIDSTVAAADSLPWARDPKSS